MQQNHLVQAALEKGDRHLGKHIRVGEERRGEKSAKSWPWAGEVKVPDSESARMALPQRQLNYRQDWTAVWRNWESALLLLYFSSVPDQKKSQKRKGREAGTERGKKRKVTKECGRKGQRLQRKKHDQIFTDDILCS